MKATQAIKQEFTIPPGLSVIEILDYGLSHMERMVDKALLFLNEYDERDSFAVLAVQTLEEKVEELFPDGYGFEAEDYDRCFWPEVITLDVLRRQSTPDTAMQKADEWLQRFEFTDEEILRCLAAFPASGGALRTEMLLARLVGMIGAYVEGWVAALLQPEPDNELAI